MVDFSFWEGKIRRILLVILFLAPIGCFFVLGNIVHAEGPTYIYNDINEPTTWTKEDSPYILRAELTKFVYMVNSELTIEPGVVIKFKPDHNTGRYAGLRIIGGEGKIIAIGNENDPIIFTSFYDNEHDSLVGSESDPLPGDWRGIEFWEDESYLENVVVRYAGIYRAGSIEFNNESSARLKKSIIENGSSSGILIDNASLPTLDNLSIRDNRNYGLIAGSSARNGILKNSAIEHNGGQYIFKIDANSGFKFENNSYQTDNIYGVDFSGTVLREVTWDDLGIPYIGRAKITSIGIVNIEPGVVFKVPVTNNRDVRILIEGELHAKGRATNPVIFTSVRDDSVGGDSNGDGDATVPSAQDWGELAFQNASATSTLNYTEVRYGGEYNGDYSGVMYATQHDCSIYIKDSYVQIDNSKIVYGDYGIINEDGGSFSLNNSHIKDNKHGIYVANQASSLPDIKNNRIYDNLIYGISYNGAESLDATYNWWGDDSGPTHADNPEGTGDIVKGNVIFDPWTGKDSLDPVILIPGIMGSWYDADDGWIIMTVGNTMDNLRDAFLENGYEKDKTYFEFPYQWRDSNVISAHRLKLKIDEVKNKTGKNKVDIVAYSMGGLVARFYIESTAYENDVDQLVFMGTPHRGAPKDYVTWEGAIFTGQIRLLMKQIFTFEARVAGYGSDLLSYIRNKVPSTEELLPDYAYLRDDREVKLRIYDDVNYPDNYPYNDFLEELNKDDNLDILYNSGVEILNIIGDTGDNTIGVIDVKEYDKDDQKWEHGEPVKYYEISGDGTVPQSSASFIAEPITVSDSKHRNLPGDAQVEVIEFLTKKTSIDQVEVKDSVDKTLVIQVYSPVDFQVIAPDGRVIGKDFDRNVNINEIENAFYSGFNNEHEIVIIPNPIDGEYRIFTRGIGDGEYGISSHFITDVKSEDNYLFDVPVNVGEQDAYSLEIESSNIDEPVVIFEPFDIEPPVINILFPEDKQYLHSGIIDISYEVTDESDTEEVVLLDNEIYDSDQIDLFYLELGNHELRIDSIDKYDNSSSEIVNFVVIASLESLEFDIEKAYELGWITNVRIKSTLLSIVNGAKKWYNLYEDYKDIFPGWASYFESKLVEQLEDFQNKLDKLENFGLITNQANDLLFDQVEYIINNL
jgi:pimeloyl-ACP methyl ester carboxylesterase